MKNMGLLLSIRGVKVRGSFETIEEAKIPQ